jgi:hypothetical protein
LEDFSVCGIAQARINLSNIDEKKIKRSKAIFLKVEAKLKT